MVESPMHNHNDSLVDAATAGPPDPHHHLSISNQDLPHRTFDEYLQSAVDEAHHHPHTMHRHRPQPWAYWWIFLSLGMANSADATEILCLSYILADTTFQQSMLLMGPDGSMDGSFGGTSAAGNLAAAVFLGMLVGGLWVGTAGDVWGRRPVLLTGCTMNATAGIVAATTTHIGFLTFCRFVAGIGIGATVPPLFTLCSELAAPSQRGFWVTIVASFWMVGSLYVAGWGYVLFTHSSTTTFHIPTWRCFLVICALPSLVGGIMVAFTVPESPRFLALQGQHARAVQAAETLGTKLLGGATSSTTSSSGGDSSSVNPLHATIQRWTLRECQVQFPLTLSGISTRQQQALSSSSSSASLWTTALVELYQSSRLLYNTKHLLGSMVGLQVIWASLSFGSYGLTTWINSLFEQVHLQNIYFNAVLFALSNLPGNALTACLLDSWGRRTMLTGSLLLASLALGMFGYATGAMEPGVRHRDTLIVTAACTFQAFTIAAWNTIDVLTAEVFPTTVRSTALGLCAATGRLAAMLAQIVNGALIAQPTRLLLTSSLSLAIGAIVPYCCIPERTGLSVLDQVEQAMSLNNGPHYSHNTTNDEGPYDTMSEPNTAETNHRTFSDSDGGATYRRVPAEGHFA